MNRAVNAGELIRLLTDVPLASDMLVLIETDTGNIVKLGSARVELTTDSAPRLVLEWTP